MPDEKRTLRVEIEGRDLPGRRCAPDLHGRPCEDVHVGLARRTDTVELVPADATTARWSFDVTVRRDDDGSDELGLPCCASVRPPDVSWSVEVSSTQRVGAGYCVPSGAV